MKFHLAAVHWTVLQPIERRLSWENSRKVISSVTMENYDKALSVSLWPPCVSVSIDTIREQQRKGSSSHRARPGLTVSAPCCTAKDYGALYRDTSLRGPADPQLLSTCSQHHTMYMLCEYTRCHMHTHTSLKKTLLICLFFTCHQLNSTKWLPSLSVHYAKYHKYADEKSTSVQLRKNLKLESGVRQLRKLGRKSFLWLCLLTCAWVQFYRPSCVTVDSGCWCHTHIFAQNPLNMH